MCWPKPLIVNTFMARGSNILVGQLVSVIQSAEKQLPIGHTQFGFSDEGMPDWRNDFTIVISKEKSPVHQRVFAAS